MTLEEARSHIGDGVVYSSGFSPPEDGVITGVSASMVFVMYSGDLHSKGTDPADLTLLAQPPVPHHKWERQDKHSKVCTVCGLRAQRRPDTLRKWITEWHLPDGTRTDNRWGGEVPPCKPAGETAATAGEEN